MNRDFWNTWVLSWVIRYNQGQIEKQKIENIQIEIKEMVRSGPISFLTMVRISCDGIKTELQSLLQIINTNGIHLIMPLK